MRSPLRLRYAWSREPVLRTVSPVVWERDHVTCSDGSFTPIAGSTSSSRSTLCGLLSVETALHVRYVTGRDITSRSCGNRGVKNVTRSSTPAALKRYFE